MTDTSSRPRQFVAREPGCTGSERIAMTETTSMVPATGCLEAAWTGVRVNGTANHITAHFPVFGLHGDSRTLAIELHGRPATSADLESWLIRSGEQGRFYPGSWSEGRLWWWWHPACECKGETVKREHWDPRGPRLSLRSSTRCGVTKGRQAMTRPICARAGCGTPVGPQATGRPARFCSNACRQGAFRDRARSRAAAAAAAPPPHRSGQPVAWNAARQTMADQLRATRQDRMNRDASRLRAALEFADPAQDGPALREELRLLRAEIQERDESWADS